MLPIRGCHPLWLAFPDRSGHTHGSAGPRSLAATRGVSVDFLSSGYLDVSVPRVCSYKPYVFRSISTCFSLIIELTEAINNKLSGGLPHSEIHGSKPILGSPRLIAEYHVLHRLLLPRHPPNALFALDLIQKKTSFRMPDAPQAGSSCKRLLPETKAYFPAPRRIVVWSGTRSCPCATLGLVYLTWTTLLSVIHS